MINLDKTKVWYLASPYSSAIPEGNDKNTVMAQRHHDVQQIGAVLIQLGYLLIEPIAMCAYKANNWALPQNYDYWKGRDRAFIDRCDGVIVANMEGWKESVGVTDEITYAKSQNKPVYLLDLMTLQEL